MLSVTSEFIYFSTDGIIWEMVHDPSPYSVSHVITGNNTIVLIDSMNARFTSNGKDFSVEERDSYYQFSAGMFDGNKYVAVEGGYLGLSENALQYTKVRTEAENPMTEIYFQDDDGYALAARHIYQFDGTYYIIGSSVWKSADLYNWEQILTLEDLMYAAEDMYFNGSSYLISTYYDLFSFDGSTLSPSSVSANNVTVDGNNFIAVNGQGENFISADGLTWSKLFNPIGVSVRIYDTVVFNNNLIIYGEGGQIYWHPMQ